MTAYRWSIIAGLCWFAALGVYGQGAALLGEIGPVIGWPILLGLSLIISNYWAFRAGEWKNANAPPPAPPPRDYFVPNFGEDHDIKSTKQHMAAAETSLGHVMQASFAAPAEPPRNYFVPNFG